MKKIILFAAIMCFINVDAQENISKSIWNQIVKDKYERYAIYDMDRLIFMAMENYFDSKTGSEEEKFYMEMAFSFIVNKHLRLKRAEWELEDIEFNMKLMERYTQKIRAIHKRFREIDSIGIIELDSSPCNLTLEYHPTRKELEERERTYLTKIDSLIRIIK